MVGAITLVAALLRFPTLGVQSLWFDESFTIVQLRDSLDFFLSRIVTHQATPPFYYLIAWPWERVVGDGPVAMRSLSALLGTATVPVVYLAGRTLLTPVAGKLAALLVATSPTLVWYSQEVRPYALLVLLSSLSLLLFARAWRGEGGRDVAGFALTSALAIATHYFAAFLVAPAALALLWHRRDRATVGALAVVIIAGLAVLPLALAQRADGRGGYIAETPVGDRLWEIARQFVSGLTLAPGSILGLLGGVLLAFALARLVLAQRGGERRRGLLLLGLAACAVGMPVALGLAGENFLLLRNVLTGWVPMALAAGAGFAAVPARWVGPAAGVALAGVFAAITIAVAASPSHHRSDWRALSQTLEPPSTARAIVSQPYWSIEAFEIYRDGTFRLAEEEPLRISEVAVLGPNTPRPELARDAEALVAQLPLGEGTVRIRRVDRIRDLKLLVLELDPPRPLTPSDLLRSGLTTNPHGILFERSRQQLGAVSD
jgi:4-amino-4-deoxy-L-arabinose transferase-like glycosyltransferase